MSPETVILLLFKRLLADLKRDEEELRELPQTLNPRTLQLATDIAGISPEFAATSLERRRSKLEVSVAARTTMVRVVKETFPEIDFDENVIHF